MYIWEGKNNQVYSVDDAIRQNTAYLLLNRSTAVLDCHQLCMESR